MSHEFHDGRWVASFRPAGWGRWVQAAFLAVWLAFWVVGEAVGIALLLSIVAAAVAPGALRAFGAPESLVPSGASWFFALFMVFWVSLWTLGGVAALYECLRQIAGEDRIAWDASGVERVSRAGPIRRNRRWSRDEIERVALRTRAASLVLGTRRGTHVLTAWGTIGERQAVRDEVRRQLGEPPSRPAELPDGWWSEPDPAGGTIVRLDPRIRRTQATVAWSVTIALAALAVAVQLPRLARGSWSTAELETAAATAVALTIMAAGSAWLSHGGTGYVVRRGEVEQRGWFLGWRWGATLVPVRWHVAHSQDSDGDDWFELRALAGPVRRTVERRMNDRDAVVRLARWMADRSGAPLTMDRYMDDEERSAG